MNVSKDCPAVFNSALGSSLMIPLTFTATTLQFTINQTVARVTINTGCLEHPDILVDFTGILNVTTTASAVSTLVFTLFRNCRGADFREPLTTFTFNVTDITGGVTTSHTLAFKYLSCGNCEECCSYDFELTSISNLLVGPVTYALNGVISVLATES